MAKYHLSAEPFPVLEEDDMAEKKPLTGLFRDQPTTPEGKYLVKRRDGSVVEWPLFVLGARDPDGANTLRFYALLKELPIYAHEAVINQLHNWLAYWHHNSGSQNKEFAEAVQKWADKWDQYRTEHGDGDPLMGPHRKDDPATIEEMRKGFSA